MFEVPWSKIDPYLKTGMPLIEIASSFGIPVRLLEKRAKRLQSPKKKSRIKKATSTKAAKLRARLSEVDVQFALANILKDSGHTPKLEVPVKGGRVDVLTETAIYEVKLFLFKGNVPQYVKQLRKYKTAFPNRELFIVAAGCADGVEQKLKSEDVKLIILDL